MNAYWVVAAWMALLLIISFRFCGYLGREGDHRERLHTNKYYSLRNTIPVCSGVSSRSSIFILLRESTAALFFSLRYALAKLDCELYFRVLKLYVEERVSAHWSTRVWQCDHRCSSSVSCSASIDSVLRTRESCKW